MTEMRKCKKCKTEYAESYFEGKKKGGLYVKCCHCRGVAKPDDLLAVPINACTTLRLDERHLDSGIRWLMQEFEKAGGDIPVDLVQIVHGLIMKDMQARLSSASTDSTDQTTID